MVRSSSLVKSFSSSSSATSHVSTKILYDDRAWDDDEEDAFLRYVQSCLTASVTLFSAMSGNVSLRDRSLQKFY